MARIFKHTEVEDYFAECDLRDETARLSVARLYEAGKVIVLKNASIDYDAAFLASVEFPQDAELKKFKSWRFLQEMARAGGMRRLLGRSPGPMSELLLDKVFAGDHGRLRHFFEQMSAINAQVGALTSRLFSSYRIITDRITWRFQETVNENLHVDVYKEDLPDHHLRLFVNLDSVPRIWHTSYTLQNLLDERLSLLDPEFVRTATPGRICHDLNFAVFKSFPDAGREGCAKHIVFFDPGEIWLVDSRKISHQIFYGRKALSTDHAIERASMLDPATHYYELVERRRAASASSCSSSRRPNASSA
jgi:hypothetical protein